MHFKLFVSKDRVNEAYRRAEDILETLGDNERDPISAVKAARDKADSGSGDGGGV